MYRVARELKLSSIRPSEVRQRRTPVVAEIFCLHRIYHSIGSTVARVSLTMMLDRFGAIQAQ